MFIGCVLLESRLLRSALKFVKAFLALDGFGSSVLASRCQRRHQQSMTAKARCKHDVLDKSNVPTSAGSPLFWNLLRRARASSGLWLRFPWLLRVAGQMARMERKVSIREARRCENFASVDDKSGHMWVHITCSGDSPYFRDP